MCNLHISYRKIAVNQKCVYCTFMIQLLHPLLVVFARFLMSQTVRFPEFLEAMKKAYVDAASSGVAKITDSAISLNTGLQRRDVARLRKVDMPPASGSNPLARLVALWMSDDRFAGRSLPRVGENSFDTLAWSIGKDMHPRTLLDALEKAGAVQVVEDHVHLLVPSFLPAAGSEAQIAYLVANVADHLAAAAGNTEGGAYFERAVHYDGLTRDQVDDLHKEYAALQMQVLQTINTRAAQMQNAAPQDADMRFRAGGYFWAEDSSKTKGHKP